MGLTSKAATVLPQLLARGSPADIVADWSLLNALANCASGADWVSLHNCGGGVGIGNSTHPGMVIVATGTLEKTERLKRVLTTDPGMGIFRHADAGYELAQNARPASAGRRFRGCSSG